MERPIINIPTGFFKETAFNWDIDWRGKSAGDFTDGTTRTIYMGAPRWVGNMSFWLQGENVAKWRAIRAQAQGRRGLYRIEMSDPAGFPDIARSREDVLGFSDGSTFSDGTSFEYDPFFVAAGDYPIGSTTITVDTTTAPLPWQQLGLPVALPYQPKEGHILSHKTFPFIVTRVNGGDFSNLSIDVQMPLRSAITQGDPIYLRPRGLFEAAADLTGAAGYGADQISQVSLNLVEVLRR